MAGPHPIKISVENPDELLNAGLFDAGAVIEIQSSTAELTGYTAISGTGSTPTIAIVAGSRTYTGYDPNGDWTTWYRLRYRNSGSTRFSVDWAGDASWYTRPGHAPFQTGDEQAGLLCSLYDARQMLQQHDPTDTAQDENILGWIREVSDFILSLTGRQLGPDPASGTKTYRFHTRAGYTLWVPKGIRSITTLGIATEDQPATGGTYTTATATDYYLDPPEFERTRNWPAMRIVFRSNASTRFYTASFGAEVTGAFGWAAVPSDIQAVALNLVMAAAREGGASGGDTVTIGIGGERTYERALSTKDWRTLHFYRAMVAA